PPAYRPLESAPTTRGRTREGMAMALDRAWLLGAARAEREAMGRTIQYTEPAYWDQPSGAEGWRGRDVVAHLAGGEAAVAAAGLPARREHNPTFCVNDLAVRTIPYALSLAGLSYPGKVVRVTLRGQGGGDWRHGLAPRDVPAEGAAPDVAIDGEGYWFAKVAG